MAGVSFHVFYAEFDDGSFGHDTVVAHNPLAAVRTVIERNELDPAMGYTFKIFDSQPTIVEAQPTTGHQISVVATPKKPARRTR